MVFAKTSKAAGRLAEQIRLDQFKRNYLAIVHGHPQPLSGSLRHYLVKDRQKNIVQAVKPNTQGAQEARLNYQVVDMNAEQSLLRIQLETGRSHQIRVQMAESGHPLLGDQRYGIRTNQRLQIALWAESVSINHPTTKERLEFTELPPKIKPWTEFRLKG